MDKKHACLVILNTFCDILNGVSTLEGNVKKSRSFTHRKSGTVQLMSNSFEKVSEDSSGNCVGVYDIDLLATVAGNLKELDDKALAIDALIYESIMRDETLGLEFVDFAEHTAWTMETSAEAEQATGSGVSRYRVQFNYHRRTIEVTT